MHAPVRTRGGGTIFHTKRRFLMSAYQGFIMTAAEAREFDREAAK